MDASKVKDTSLARKIIEQRHLSHVKVGVFDIDGILRGKYMSKDKFFSALDNGFGFCDVVLGWDSKDQLYDNVSYTGWHTGYPDAKMRIIPESCRDIPYEQDMLFFLAEFTDKAADICPRALLRRVCQKATDMGYEIMSGFEYEFFVFNETPLSIQDKNFQNLQAFTAGDFGYSVIRNTVESDVYHSILNLSELMDFPIEGLHEETGPGVLEAALVYSAAQQSADRAALFKTFTKILLQKQQKMATFMAKWSANYPGQSGHIHLSLNDSHGKNIFFDAKSAASMSNIMTQFVAGCQLCLPELLSMVAPTINSYKRLVPDLWAPTHASVGIDNRTCAIRIIPGSEKSQRMEYRIGAADANPYIILAAVIASGLWGIENNAEIESMVSGNAYDAALSDNLKLSDSLWQATQVLRQSSMAKSWFGTEFVEHYAASREWEVREFNKHVSQWELERYFEII
ncbi:glutamine synthetase family protein [hydrothermal vent metagenome]|uniref:Glutamine synthetase family protein n=1 Tax=hydrothermal vent metagenome TaxID=652676 RepID=A0A3B1B9J9_9ZZZZ